MSSNPLSSRLLLLACAVLLTGCQASTFGRRPAPFAAPQPGVEVTRIYLDELGDLYPDSTIVMSDDELRSRDHRLGDYFAARVASDEWRSLRSRYRIPPNLPFDSSWSLLQARLRDEYAERLARVSGSRRPLVVLVHGFNASDARIGYDSIRAELVRRRSDVSILEVYWDGWDFSWGVGVWGEGQHNSYLAGLGLRRILNRIDAETPVRIITHSLGGGVATAALWNIERRLDCESAGEAWCEMYRAMRSDPVLHGTPVLNDLRLGMLVPATTGNTFMDFVNRTPPDASTEIDRVIIGINPLDFPVTKGGIGCQRVGYSCLGSESSEFWGYVDPRLNRDGQRIAYCIDFSRSSKNRDIYWPFFWREAHALTSYLRRDAAGEFLSALLDDSVPSLPHACPPPHSPSGRQAAG